MQKQSLLTQFLALFLCVGFILPSPALGLRASQVESESRRSNLERALRNGPDATLSFLGQTLGDLVQPQTAEPGQDEDDKAVVTGTYPEPVDAPNATAVALTAVASQLEAIAPFEVENVVVTMSIHTLDAVEESTTLTLNVDAVETWQATVDDWLEPHLSDSHSWIMSYSSAIIPLISSETQVHRMQIHFFPMDYDALSQDRFPAFEEEAVIGYIRRLMFAYHAYQTLYLASNPDIEEMAIRVHGFGGQMLRDSFELGDPEAPVQLLIRVNEILGRMGWISARRYVREFSFDDENGVPTLNIQLNDWKQDGDALDFLELVAQRDAFQERPVADYQEHLDPDARGIPYRLWVSTDERVLVAGYADQRVLVQMGSAVETHDWRSFESHWMPDWARYELRQSGWRQGPVGMGSGSSMFPLVGLFYEPVEVGEPSLLTLGLHPDTQFSIGNLPHNIRTFDGRNAVAHYEAVEGEPLPRLGDGRETDPGLEDLDHVRWVASERVTQERRDFFTARVREHPVMGPLFDSIFREDFRLHVVVSAQGNQPYWLPADRSDVLLSGPLAEAMPDDGIILILPVAMFNQSATVWRLYLNDSVGNLLLMTQQRERWDAIHDLLDNGEVVDVDAKQKLIIELKNATMFQAVLDLDYDALARVLMMSGANIMDSAVASGQHRAMNDLQLRMVYLLTFAALPARYALKFSEDRYGFYYQQIFRQAGVSLSEQQALQEIYQRVIRPVFEDGSWAQPDVFSRLYDQLVQELSERPPLAVAPQDYLDRLLTTLREAGQLMLPPLPVGVGGDQFFVAGEAPATSLLQVRVDEVRQQLLIQSVQGAQQPSVAMVLQADASGVFALEVQQVHADASRKLYRPEGLRAVPVEDIRYDVGVEGRPSVLTIVLSEHQLLESTGLPIIEVPSHLGIRNSQFPLQIRFDVSAAQAQYVRQRLATHMRRFDLLLDTQNWDGLPFYVQDLEGIILESPVEVASLLGGALEHFVQQVEQVGLMLQAGQVPEPARPHLERWYFDGIILLSLLRHVPDSLANQALIDLTHLEPQLWQQYASVVGTRTAMGNLNYVQVHPVHQALQMLWSMASGSGNVSTEDPLARGIQEHIQASVESLSADIGPDQMREAFGFVGQRVGEVPQSVKLAFLRREPESFWNLHAAHVDWLVHSVRYLGQVPRETIRAQAAQLYGALDEIILDRVSSYSVWRPNFAGLEDLEEHIHFVLAEGVDIDVPEAIKPFLLSSPGTRELLEQVVAEEKPLWVRVQPSEHYSVDAVDPLNLTRYPWLPEEASDGYILLLPAESFAARGPNRLTQVNIDRALAQLWLMHDNMDLWAKADMHMSQLRATARALHIAAGHAIYEAALIMRLRAGGHTLLSERMSYAQVDAFLEDVRLREQRLTRREDRYQRFLTAVIRILFPLVSADTRIDMNESLWDPAERLGIPKAVQHILVNQRIRQALALGVEVVLSQSFDSFYDIVDALVEETQTVSLLAVQENPTHFARMLEEIALRGLLQRAPGPQMPGVNTYFTRDGFFRLTADAQGGLSVDIRPEIAYTTGTLVVDGDVDTVSVVAGASGTIPLVAIRHVDGAYEWIPKPWAGGDAEPVVTDDPPIAGIRFTNLDWAPDAEHTLFFEPSDSLETAREGRAHLPALNGVEASPFLGARVNPRHARQSVSMSFWAGLEDLDHVYFLNTLNGMPSDFPEAFRQFLSGHPPFMALVENFVSDDMPISFVVNAENYYDLAYVDEYVTDALGWQDDVPARGIVVMLPSSLMNESLEDGSSRWEGHVHRVTRELLLMADLPDVWDQSQRRRAETVYAEPIGGIDVNNLAVALSQDLEARTALHHEEAYLPSVFSTLDNLLRQIQETEMGNHSDYGIRSEFIVVYMANFRVLLEAGVDTEGRMERFQAAFDAVLPREQHQALFELAHEVFDAYREENRWVHTPGSVQAIAEALDTRLNQLEPVRGGQLDVYANNLASLQGNGQFVASPANAILGRSLAQVYTTDHLVRLDSSGPDLTAYVRVPVRGPSDQHTVPIFQVGYHDGRFAFQAFVPTVSQATEPISLGPATATRTPPVLGVQMYSSQLPGAPNNIFVVRLADDVQNPGTTEPFYAYPQLGVWTEEPPLMRIVFEGGRASEPEGAAAGAVSRETALQRLGHIRAVAEELPEAVFNSPNSGTVSLQVVFAGTVARVVPDTRRDLGDPGVAAIAQAYFVEGEIPEETDEDLDFLILAAPVIVEAMQGQVTEGVEAFDVEAIVAAVETSVAQDNHRGWAWLTMDAADDIEVDARLIRGFVEPLAEWIGVPVAHHPAVDTQVLEDIRAWRDAGVRLYEAYQNPPLEMPGGTLGDLIHAVAHDLPRDGSAVTGEAFEQLMGAGVPLDRDLDEVQLAARVLVYRLFDVIQQEYVETGYADPGAVGFSFMLDLSQAGPAAGLMGMAAIETDTMQRFVDRAIAVTGVPAEEPLAGADASAAAIRGDSEAIRASWVTTVSAGQPQLFVEQALAAEVAATSLSALAPVYFDRAEFFDAQATPPYTPNEEWVILAAPDAVTEIQRQHDEQGWADLDEVLGFLAHEATGDSDFGLGVGLRGLPPFPENHLRAFVERMATHLDVPTTEPGLEGIEPTGLRRVLLVTPSAFVDSYLTESAERWLAEIETDVGYSLGLAEGLDDVRDAVLTTSYQAIIFLGLNFSDELREAFDLIDVIRPPGTQAPMIAVFPQNMAPYESFLVNRLSSGKIDFAVERSADPGYTGGNWTWQLRTQLLQPIHEVILAQERIAIAQQAVYLLNPISVTPQVAARRNLTGLEDGDDDAQEKHHPVAVADIRDLDHALELLGTKSIQQAAVWIRQHTMPMHTALIEDGVPQRIVDALLAAFVDAQLRYQQSMLSTLEVLLHHSEFLPAFNERQEQVAALALARGHAGTNARLSAFQSFVATTPTVARVPGDAAVAMQIAQDRLIRVFYEAFSDQFVGEGLIGIGPEHAQQHAEALQALALYSPQEVRQRFFVVTGQQDEDAQLATRLEHAGMRATQQSDAMVTRLEDDFTQANLRVRLFAEDGFSGAFSAELSSGNFNTVEVSDEDAQMDLSQFLARIFEILRGVGLEEYRDTINVDQVISDFSVLGSA